MNTRPFTVQALVLAAGDSTRLGEDKALVDLDGRSALQRIAMALPHHAHVVCVTGTNHQAVQEHVQRHPSTFQHWVFRPNPDPGRGRTSSIQTGLRDLSPHKPFLLWPVDHPLVSPETVMLLLLTTPLAANAFRIPVCSMRRGHPVLLGRALHVECARLGVDQPLRDLVQDDHVELEEITCEDEGVLVNIDTQAALQDARRQLNKGGSS
ncbi:MAG: nucleotidyltransferase family protein [Planctomycetes bacterium]|nr:nucleotidyltransferase family protein [Planctomycetota bacterium]